MRTHLCGRTVALVGVIGIRHEDDVDVISGIARQVTVHRLATRNIGIMGFANDRDVAYVIPLSQILNFLAIGQVLWNTDALGLQIEEVLVGNLLQLGVISCEPQIKFANVSRSPKLCTSYARRVIDAMGATRS
jgi:hypothetical protein